ncbi:unnamed protein product, partial [Sphenostylis stenocarpa]
MSVSDNFHGVNHLSTFDRRDGVARQSNKYAMQCKVAVGRGNTTDEKNKATMGVYCMEAKIGCTRIGAHRIMHDET